MTINKTKVFIAFVSAKSCVYIIGKRDDFQIVSDLVCDNQYLASIEKALELIVDTLEYVASINF